MELEIDYQTCRALFEAEVPTLSDYFVGFALPIAENGSINAGLGGSGTLVAIDEVHGILTANHVIRLLDDRRFVGLILPSRFEAQIHHLPLRMDDCSHVVFPSRGKATDGPDLGLLIPPPDILSTMWAKKSFYSLSNRQRRMLEEPAQIDEGFWVLSGMADEWTQDLSPEKGFSRVKQFKGLHGVGVVTKEYDRGKFDYLIFETLYDDAYEGPDSYGGFSGGGLWQLLVKPDGDRLQIADRLLCGVAFYQSEQKCNAGQVTRDISCHGRRSLYQALVEEVRARRS